MKKNEAGEEMRTGFGYGILFDTYSRDLGGFKEVIKRESVNYTDPSVFAGHDQNKPMGRLSKNTLRLSVDERGVKYEFDVPNTTWGNDFVESAKRGEYRGSSFGFRVMENGATWSEQPDESDGLYIRTINKMEIFELSPVTFPAYEDTSIAVRQLDDITGKKETPDYVSINKSKIDRILFG